MSKRRILIYTIIGIAAVVLLILLFRGCGSKSASDATDRKWQYEVVDSYVDQYVDLVINSEPSPIAVQSKLLDIRSRCYELEQNGYPDLAEYFRYRIEERLRAVAPRMADELLGKQTAAIQFL